MIDHKMTFLESIYDSTNWGLFDHVQMRLDLEAIFKRKVDLVTRRALAQTQNRLLREQILKTAKVIFAGGEAIYIGDSKSADGLISLAKL